MLGRRGWRLAGALLAVVAVSGTVVPGAAGAAGDSNGVASVAVVDKHLTREVFGFVQSHMVDELRGHLDYSVLSTIAFFGIPATSYGHLDHGSEWSVWRGSRTTALINDAHRAGTRVVLSVTGFAWTSLQRERMVALLSSSARRAQLAREIAAEVVYRHVDGVNLDFEPIPSGHRSEFTSLVRQVHAALRARDPKLTLTFDVTGFHSSYDIAGATAPGGADAVLIMGYHYRGSWSSRAGSIAPLSGPEYDVGDTVRSVLALTHSPAKVILGVGYYGYLWPTTSSVVRSSVRPAGRTYGYPGSVTYRTAMPILSSHGRLWDSVEQSAWTRWQSRACSYCPLTWRQLYIDDAPALGRKYDLVNREDLSGVAIWSLGYEGGYKAPTEMLRTKFVGP